MYKTSTRRTTRNRRGWTNPYVSRLRFKDGEGHGAGGGTGGENNNGGESSGGGNNTGEDDLLASFWGGSDGSSDSSQRSDSQGPSGQQNGNGNGGNQQQNQQQPPSFRDRIKGINSNAIMTDQVMAALGEGNAEPFHQAFNGAIQQANEQMFTMTVELMQTFGERLMSAMDERMNQSHTTRDDNSFLEQHFPSAKDPKIRPMVDKVYQQALKNTKNDRQAAIQQTKDMLRLMSTMTAEDTGFSSGQQQGGGFVPPGGKQKGGSWLDRLKDEVSQ